MFVITPMSEEDALKANLLEKGNYPFVVNQAIMKKDKNGNDMLEVRVGVSDMKGRSFKVYDYLTNDASFAFKLRHFFYAVGLGEQYEKGMINPALLPGKTGRAKVGIRVDKTGSYPPKNIIGDYIYTDTKLPIASEPLIDTQDIPF